jgi:hypothetical protein
MRGVPLRQIGSAAVGAVRRRRGTVLLVVLAILVLNLILPPLVLSVARKPADHISLNPWLRRVPAWLRDDPAPWTEKVRFLANAALLWFVASGKYDAAEWGFTVTTRDVGRWLLMGVLFGAYTALWLERRAQLRAGVAGASRRGGQAGTAGAVLSTLGFSTMPCSVAGCGAPVMPVLGLALTGLSSGTISLISGLSRVLIWVVLAAVVAAVWVLARQVAAAGAAAAPSHRSPPPSGAVSAG